MPAPTMKSNYVKTHFAQVLDRVEQGEEITITRRGRVVARIVPEAPADLDVHPLEVLFDEGPRFGDDFRLPPRTRRPPRDINL